MSLGKEELAWVKQFLSTLASIVKAALKIKKPIAF